MNTHPQCRLCKHTANFLGEHLEQEHQMTVEEYLDQFPGSPTASEALLEATALQGKRYPVTSLDGLKVEFGGVNFPLYHQVPVEACLPPAPHHTFPSQGKALQAAKRLIRHLFYNRHTVVWGPSGSGKDAVLSTWSWACRRPGAIFQVRPETNLEGWLRSREIGPEGTFYEDGHFLRLYRDGYEIKDEEGNVVERIPCVLVITDMDRATEEQMETFRLIMDSISGRFVDPEGETHYMLPGTLILATSNTIGGGDDTGLYRSSRPQDASMISRFPRAVRWHYLDWVDEEQLCRKKFPGLVARDPTILPAMESITRVVRSAVESRQVQTIFGHREVGFVLEAAWDIVRMNGGVLTSFLLRDAMLGVVEKSRDEFNIKAVKDLVDPHVDGDMYGV